MAATKEIQSEFLNKARQSKQQVTVFLMNGFQLHGNVAGFDNFAVVLNSDGKQQMIYKHAISTIIPSNAINLAADESKLAG